MMVVMVWWCGGGVVVCMAHGCTCGGVYGGGMDVRVVWCGSDL